MKKWIVGILTLAMVIAFGTGCGDKADSGSGSSASSIGKEQGYEDKTDNAQTAQKDDAQEAEVPSTTEDVTITINGEDYEFPMTYDDFTSKGWTYYDPSAGDPETWENAG